jgi:hypothetical protein
MLPERSSFAMRWCLPSRASATAMQPASPRFVLRSCSTLKQQFTASAFASARPALPLSIVVMCSCSLLSLFSTLELGGIRSAVHAALYWLCPVASWPTAERSSAVLLVAICTLLGKKSSSLRSLALCRLQLPALELLLLKEPHELQSVAHLGPLSSWPMLANNTAHNCKMPNSKSKIKEPVPRN